MATTALPAQEARFKPGSQASAALARPLPAVARAAMGGPDAGPRQQSAPVRAREPLSIRAWALLAVIGLHVAVFAALLTQRYVVPDAPPLVVVELLSIPPSPPPPAEAPKIVMEIPPVVIPPPVFEIEDRPLTITAVVVENPPPPQVSSPAPVAVAEGPASASHHRMPTLVSGVDLSANMIAAVPPKYPYESRRLKEQGTVVLDVQLSAAGVVERIAIRSSSGFQRLDKAALEAVRRWRWSPTQRGGQAVAVRGLVEIPFKLTPRG